MHTCTCTFFCSFHHDHNFLAYSFRPSILPSPKIRKLVVLWHVEPPLPKRLRLRRYRNLGFFRNDLDLWVLKTGEGACWMWKITSECQQVFDQPRTHLENSDNSLYTSLGDSQIYSFTKLTHWLGCQWPPEGVKISPRNNPFVIVKLEHGGTPWLTKHKPRTKDFQYGPIVTCL